MLRFSGASEQGVFRMPPFFLSRYDAPQMSDDLSRKLGWLVIALLSCATLPG
jgi:hypothetical protein